MSYTIDEFLTKYPDLACCKQSILDAYDILLKSFQNGGKLLICGNGGSCADAEHIVGELMKGFKKRRPVSDDLKDKLCAINPEKGALLANSLQGALPAIALDGHQALNTAFINDVENGGELSFAQQVMGYGNLNDVLLGISTSGNAKNIYNAAIVAKAKGMKVIALTGKDGGKLKELADVSIIVPEKETFMIQERHLPIYHLLCLMLEDAFFNE